MDCILFGDIIYFRVRLKKNEYKTRYRYKVSSLGKSEVKLITKLAEIDYITANNDWHSWKANVTDTFKIEIIQI